MTRYLQNLAFSSTLLWLLALTPTACSSDSTAAGSTPDNAAPPPTVVSEGPNGTSVTALQQTPPQPESGSRLRARYLTLDDGTKLALEGWYDSKQKNLCTFMPVQQDRWACLPVAQAQLASRLDATCSQPINAGPPDGNITSVFAYDKSRLRCPGWYEITAYTPRKIDVPSAFYQDTFPVIPPSPDLLASGQPAPETCLPQPGIPFMREYLSTFSGVTIGAPGSVAYDVNALTYFQGDAPMGMEEFVGATAQRSVTPEGYPFWMLRVDDGSKAWAQISADPCVNPPPQPTPVVQPNGAPTEAEADAGTLTTYTVGSGTVEATYDVTTFRDGRFFNGRSSGILVGTIVLSNFTDELVGSLTFRRRADEADCTLSLLAPDHYVCTPSTGCRETPSSSDLFSDAACTVRLLRRTQEMVTANPTNICLIDTQLYQLSALKTATPGQAFYERDFSTKVCVPADPTRFRYAEDTASYVEALAPLPLTGLPIVTRAGD